MEPPGSVGGDKARLFCRANLHTGGHFSACTDRAAAHWNGNTVSACHMPELQPVPAKEQLERALLDRTSFLSSLLP